MDERRAALQKNIDVIKSDIQSRRAGQLSPLENHYADSIVNLCAVIEGLATELVSLSKLAKGQGFAIELLRARLIVIRKAAMWDKSAALAEQGLKDVDRYLARLSEQLK